MNLPWSELWLAVVTGDLRGSPEDHKVRSILEVPVLMSPVLAGNSYSRSGLINYEGNVLLCSELSDLLVESRCCKVVSEEGQRFHDDGSHRKLTLSHSSLELLEASLFLIIIEPFIVDHWESKDGSRSSQPVEPWLTFIILFIQAATTSKCLRMI